MATVSNEPELRIVRDPNVYLVGRQFAAGRAQELGFEAEQSFDEIIQVYVDEEMGA